jgi:8-oxo-dGTP pyrophosphatase MutT (NUDIX family)
MSKLQDFHAKVCWPAAGCLIHDGKVLLVKHKKLGFWLNPGGHVEENELPHQTAEREFWEEAGIKVRAINAVLKSVKEDSEYLPHPMLSGLHWVCKDNYDARVDGKKLSEEMKKKWARGCEQHFHLLYLVEPVDINAVEFTEDVVETDGVSWFSKEELAKLETRLDIKEEVAYAFKLREELDKKAAKRKKVQV